MAALVGLSSFYDSWTDICCVCLDFSRTEQYVIKPCRCVDPLCRTCFVRCFVVINHRNVFKCPLCRYEEPVTWFREPPQLVPLPLQLTPALEQRARRNWQEFFIVLGGPQLVRQYLPYPTEAVLHAALQTTNFSHRLLAGICYNPVAAYRYVSNQLRHFKRRASAGLPLV